MPLTTTTYIVVAVTEEGCTEPDTVTVRKADNLFVYTAFSPNGDGVNDHWDIDNASTIPILLSKFITAGERSYSARKVIAMTSAGTGHTKVKKYQLEPIIM